MSTLRFNLRTDKPDRFTKCPIELIYQVSGQRKYYQLKDIKLNPINWDAVIQSAVYVNPTKAKKILPEGLYKSIDIIVLFGLLFKREKTGFHTYSLKRTFSYAHSRLGHVFKNRYSI